MKKSKPASRSHTSDQSKGIDTPIQFCPGVGPKRGQLFRKLGVETIRDLLWLLPRGYEDFHTVTPAAGLCPGEVATVLGTVQRVSERRPYSRGKVRHILRAEIDDQTGSLLAVWFNQPFLTSTVRTGARLRLHGKVELYDHMIQLTSPKVQSADDEDDNTQGLAPLYPLCEGLRQGNVRKAVQNALDRYGSFCVEFLPDTILQHNRFPSRFETFRILHAPKPGEGAPSDIPISEESLLQSIDGREVIQPFLLRSNESESLWERARKRLVYEEFLLHQFIFCRYRGRVKREPGIAHPLPVPDPLATDTTVSLSASGPQEWPAVFLRNLPFQLTPSQREVCRELQEDLHNPSPMNRLLQGDVGSGKTVVSVYAMLVAAAGGRQAALMAPTEILARQHAANIQRMTETLPGLNSVLLTGGAKTAERREALSLIDSGASQIVIGTHALFQESVTFHNLGMVVVDEQHKFGVSQRQRLIDKGLHPDLLVSTATPIPRTLSLTWYGDMDVSTIRDLPPGRPPLITRWTTWENGTKLWKFVDEKIEEGQQAYVVCPIIEPSENMPQLPSTEQAFDALSKTFLPHRRVEILHGRHSTEVKTDLMSRMREGAVDVVVATTVIEVGVDLPNATMMVVLGAERFGLAQLHQLRGRVGRGTKKSYCVLITHNRIPPFAQDRMRILERTRDGFEIAEEDCRMRGPGEYFGTRQTGHLNFRLADPIHDSDLLKDANLAATALYEDDPDLTRPQHSLLKEEIRLAYGRHDFNRPS